MAENTQKRLATKKKMQSALIELYQQYEYQKITVTMICKQAALHRSTFYLYYNSVDDLLREIENDLLLQIRKYSEGFSRTDISIIPLDTILYQTEPLMIEFYEWQYSMRDYLNPLLGPYGDPYFIQHYEEITQHDICTALTQLGYDCINNPYLLKYITGGVVRTNIDWLLNGDIPTSELVHLQRTMVFKNPFLPVQKESHLN